MIGSNSTVLDKLKLAIFLLLWYSTATGNGLFSRSSSKYLLNAASEPSSSVLFIIQGSIALSFVQLLLTGVGGLGSVYARDVLRSVPKGVAGPTGLVKSLASNFASRKWRHSTYLIGMLNFLGVVSTNLSFFLGSVSLTHLIKSSEPLFTSMYSFIISPESSLSSKKFSGMVLITLGVATASYSNKAGAYYGCAAALLSSLLFPLRNVLIKKMASKEDVMTINGLHLFYIISFVSSMIGVVVIFVLNVSPVIREPWKDHIRTVSLSPARNALYFDTVMSAITFLSYNTFSMIVLQQCSVSTHAIFNILKRGVVILISAVFIDHNLNQHLILGTSLAMVGLWLYKS